MGETPVEVSRGGSDVFRIKPHEESSDAQTMSLKGLTRRSSYTAVIAMALKYDAS